MKYTSFPVQQKKAASK